MTHYTVLDSLGNIVWQFDGEGLIGMPALTSDGHYGMIPYLTTITPNIERGSDGWELWNIKKNILLHREVNTTKNRILGGVGLNSISLLGSYYSYPNDTSISGETTYFLPENSTLMTRKVSSAEMRETNNFLKKLEDTQLG